jgi:secondary thiamine-phosphate synthase enzyme
MSAATRHHAASFVVATPGRSTVDITRDIQNAVGGSDIESGLCNVFVHHTSASLILCENADPTVRSDLERFFAAAVPDGDPKFEHTAEGPDDMPAHVRSVLTASSLTIPVAGGRCALGTWQGVYLYEHRHGAHQRRVTVSILGS